jgi:hypothetical protein
VWKTTTAAKIAARGGLEGGQRVAFLTIDTYRRRRRPPALRRHPGVPVGVARSADELQALPVRRR